LQPSARATASLLELEPPLLEFDVPEEVPPDEEPEDDDEVFDIVPEEVLLEPEELDPDVPRASEDELEAERSEELPDPDEPLLEPDGPFPPSLASPLSLEELEPHAVMQSVLQTNPHDRVCRMLQLLGWRCIRSQLWLVVRAIGRRRVSH